MGITHINVHSINTHVHTHNNMRWNKMFHRDGRGWEGNMGRGILKKCWGKHEDVFNMRYQVNTHDTNGSKTLLTISNLSPQSDSLYILWSEIMNQNFATQTKICPSAINCHFLRIAASNPTREIIPPLLIEQASRAWPPQTFMKTAASKCKTEKLLKQCQVIWMLVMIGAKFNTILK